MSGRQEIRVTIFDCEQYDDGFPAGYGSSLEGFVAWVTQQLNSIPVAHRGSARIEISSVSSWEDSHYSRITITYDRPETDEEMRGRLERVAQQGRERQSHELATLAALKKKYESS